MNTFPLCTGCLTSAAATAAEKTAFDIPGQVMWCRIGQRMLKQTQRQRATDVEIDTVSARATDRLSRSLCGVAGRQCRSCLPRDRRSQSIAMPGRGFRLYPGRWPNNLSWGRGTISRSIPNTLSRWGEPRARRPDSRRNRNSVTAIKRPHG